jgi:hypothetical protein
MTAPHMVIPAMRAGKRAMKFMWWISRKKGVQRVMTADINFGVAKEFMAL